MKLFIMIHEKHYKSQTYMFQKYRNSNSLIIVFSAFGGKCQPGGYNYVWSLRSIKTNKLWIRDRFGYCAVGTYYLGKYDGVQFTNVKEITELIKKYNSDKRTFFCGTSKGGSAALFYGLKFPDSIIVSGSPQFYIGDYLNQNEYHKKIKQSIYASYEIDSILNELLPKCIKQYSCNSKLYDVFLLISTKEPSYKHHLSELIKEMVKEGYNVHINDMRYENHNDVGKFFPDYLKTIMKGDIK